MACAKRKYIIIYISQWVPQTDHWEVSAEVRRQDVGDTRGERSGVSIRNVVRYDIYRETAGNRGTVGDITTTI